MSANNKTSYLVTSQVPEFVRSDHPQFVKFMEAYYKFLEQDGNQSYVTKNVLRFLDVDVIDKDILDDLGKGELHNTREDKSYHIFLQKLYDNYLKVIPDYSYADRTVILKHAKDFYRARGSEKSLKFLLNIITPKLIESNYQRVNVLRLKTTLYNNVSTTALTTVTKYQGKTIVGANSFATASVESVKQYYDANTLVTEMVVIDVTDNFENGENVFVVFTESNANSRLESTLFGNSVIANTNTVISGVSVWPSRFNVTNLSYSTARYPEVYYPKTDILKASDGKWYVEKTLRITDTQLNNVANTDYSTLSYFVNTQIRGATTNTKAIIEKVNRFYEGSTLVDELVISAIDGDFINGEKITTFSQQGDSVYFLSTNIFNGAINTVTVTKPGTSYNVGDIITVESTTGANANVVVSKVSKSNISSVVVTYGGAGFIVNDSVLFTSTTGTGANAKVALVDTSGNVHPNSYNVIYNTIDLEANTAINDPLYLNLSTSISDPANAWIQNLMSSYTITGVGPVESILITNAGSNYGPPIGIDISSNTALRNRGSIGRLEITEPGLLYQKNDKIYFTNSPGGYGFGAYANVTNVSITGEITEIRLESLNGEIIGGAGYENNHLPTTNVSSTFGFGAEITVKTVLGDGEILQVANSSLGGIEELTIINRGDGYDVPPTLNLTSIGDGTAQAVSTIIEGIYTYPGRYLNEDGRLSSQKYLQNKDFYQNFSYVIKAKSTFDSYKKQLDDTVHVAGTRTFAEVMYEDDGVITGFDNDFLDANVVFEQQPVGVIQEIVVTSPGSLYSIGDPVGIQNTGNSGANASAIVSEVIAGNVNNVRINFGGAGFRVNDYITFTNTDAVARVFAVDSSDTYHPNTYLIYTDTISSEANTTIGNVLYSNISSTTDPANNAFRDIINAWEYANSGPAVKIMVIAAGNNTNVVPTADIASNTYVKNLGIVGRIEIVDGGLGYQKNNKIIFTNHINTPNAYGAYANVTNVAANGKITAVALESYNGEHIGGRFYSQDYLPTATVVTSTGNGANIMVRAIIGDGENLTISNTSIGGILKISVINRGDGYNTAPTINLTANGDGLATAYAIVETDPEDIEDLI